MQTIKEIRQATGLSQSKFAGALNIPIRTLQKWEVGERECPPYVVELIAFRVEHDPQFKPSQQPHHRCKYCDKMTIGSNEDLLCDDCREMFGHSFYSEL